jgi:UPF0755 protein
LPNKEAAITLASILEKETSLDAERPRVAAVYLNRLQRHMPLQADPTVIFAINAGENFGIRLTYADLKNNSPYNTYKHTGLPIGPICNPGEASIMAVLHPAHTDELYFVADGAGGHRFAQSFEAHKINVQKYRRTIPNVQKIITAN